jgi:hypothetical protein
MHKACQDEEANIENKHSINNFHSAKSLKGIKENLNYLLTKFD